MELTIDTASATASVALTRCGELVSERTWHTGRGHATELLPSIERLLAECHAERTDIRAIFVCRGPGGYGGLRVGLSTALALALALDAEVLGYGRLEADAAPHLAQGQTVCAVHDAGRGEFAWAVYQRSGDVTRELVSPTLGAPEHLLSALAPTTVVVGEVPESLAAALVAVTPTQPIISGAVATRRAAAVAAMLWPRFQDGARDNRLALTPIYLREPNITQSRAGRNATANLGA